jgi:magnesium-transporting ATPase (P-type)
VEALGSTTIICTDKTGTLTENQMTVQQILAGGSAFEVTGGGYESHGEIRRHGQAVPSGLAVALHECLRAGLLCNEAHLTRKNGRFVVQGDPTEGALIVAAQKAGLSVSETSELHQRLDTLPFASENQYMATLHTRPDGVGKVVYLKGAVERLLDRCTNALGEDGTESAFDKEGVRHAAETMAAQGLRVLAFARRFVTSELIGLAHEDVSSELTFLGLQAMIDPPRPEAISAIHQCQRAGIRVKMITGDHLLTAKAVARQIGLNGSNGPDHALQAISGDELDRCPDAELQDTAERTDIFARVEPEQKLRLVQALQARRHVVAMTGDGVNDAPALKQADIGVAMGIAGTDVAKGAADMMLTDDNFASIEAAVEEGRNVFDNLTKFIVWTLPTNFGQGLIIMAAVFVGTTLPILPVQLLWVNMTTVLLLGLTLVFEPKELDLMERPPRGGTTPIMTFPMVMRTALVSALMLGGAFGLFVWEQAAHGATVSQARTVAVNVIVMILVFYLLNCRSLTRSMFAVGMFSNPWILGGTAAMVVAQLLFTYSPIMNRLFHTAPIGGQAWLHILAVAVFACTVVGAEKRIRYRWTTAVDGRELSRTPNTSDARWST